MTARGRPPTAPTPAPLASGAPASAAVGLLNVVVGPGRRRIRAAVAVEAAKGAARRHDAVEVLRPGNHPAAGARVGEEAALGGVDVDGLAVDGARVDGVDAGAVGVVVAAGLCHKHQVLAGRAGSGVEVVARRARPRRRARRQRRRRLREIDHVVGPADFGVGVAVSVEAAEGAARCQDAGEVLRRGKHPAARAGVGEEAAVGGVDVDGLAVDGARVEDVLAVAGGVVVAVGLYREEEVLARRARGYLDVEARGTRPRGPASRE